MILRIHPAHDILRLAIEPAPVLMLEMLSDKHAGLQRMAQLIGAVPPLRHVISHRGQEQPSVIGTRRVAPHHAVLQTFERDRSPGVHRCMVLGYRHLFDARTQLAEPLCCRHHLVIHIRFRIGMSKSLFQDADAHADDAASQRLGVAVNLGLVLPRIKPVFPCQHFQQQSVVRHGLGDRAKVVDCLLDPHGAGIGHQPVRGFHAVNAAVRRRYADRTTLIPGNGHVDFVAGDQCGRSAGRTSRHIAAFPRIVHRPLCVGMGAARKAEVFTMRLARDNGTGTQHPGHNGGIDLGRVPFHDRRSVHHRHTGKAHGILKHDTLAAQLPVGRAAHFGLHVPGVHRVFRLAGKIAGTARIAHFRQVVRHRVKPVVGLHVRFDDLCVFGQIFVRHAHAKAVGHRAHL
ncbi:hypothetical protein SULPSESMR1_04534 (plasmid) [Pseudosulfitobacter pseudonitzschiae]|uniref:Uncharacterized protein n=1 Tax=Pseudosulfitobacter pseudonitzschiae TaxID=1402135 RepID=A0A221K8R2_9RHOB|nr:hypothetical protein SULPSESMR1_04534 [Pseudosulfitobacter pseudonitzschiae]